MQFTTTIIIVCDIKHVNSSFSFCLAHRLKSFKNILESRAVVLNLWVVTPLEVAYLISCISDIYIMIHNSNKIKVMK